MRRKNPFGSRRVGTKTDLNLELSQLNCRNAQTDKRRENTSVAASRLWVSLFAAG
jgi:hypothetical protein